MNNPRLNIFKSEDSFSQPISADKTTEIEKTTHEIHIEYDDTVPASSEAGVTAAKRYIYILTDKDTNQIFYVGDSNDPRERGSSHKYDVINLKRGVTEAVKYMRSALKSRNVNVLMQVISIVDVQANENGSNPTLASAKEEQDLIVFLSNAGHPICNKLNLVKAPKPKQEKAPRAPAGTKGGGWQVKADWIGKGMKIRCKAPYDGSFWECDHDALVDAINASLKAKGKTLIGEPGPSEKQYGATSGLRESQLWTRVQ